MKTLAVQLGRKKLMDLTRFRNFLKLLSLNLKSNTAPDNRRLSVYLCRNFEPASTVSICVTTIESWRLREFWRKWSKMNFVD